MNRVICVENLKREFVTKKGLFKKEAKTVKAKLKALLDKKEW